MTKKIRQSITTKVTIFFLPGFPQVEYRWMKDGVFLSDFSSEHFYKIQSVSRSDAGYYRCYAKNSVGTIISEKIRLIVACKESYLMGSNHYTMCV